MHRSNLVLLFTIFALLITNNCWAQEPTPTTDALESTTIAPPSDSSIIDEILTATNNDSTTHVLPEAPTADLELSSDPNSSSFDSILGPDPTPGIPEAPSNSSTPESPPSNSIPAPPESNFTAFVSVDTLRDCDAITISWSGVHIEPAYEITYSNGIGELEDESILGPEVRIGYSCEQSYVWQVPPTANVLHGNVARFTITDLFGRGWRTHVWVPLASAGATECPPLLNETQPDTSYLDDLVSQPSSAPFSIQLPGFTTITEKPSFETSNPTVGPGFAPVMSGPIMISPPTQTRDLTVAPTLTTTRNLNPNSNPSPSPNPNLNPNASLNTRTVTVNGSPITIAPFVNGNNNNPRPNPMGNNGNAPRPSGGNNSPNPMDNSPRPSVPILGGGGNSQGSNNGNQVPGIEYIRIPAVSVGDSTTYTFFTEIPQQVQSTSHTFGGEQSLVPTTTTSDGQKNDGKRGGLPPAAIGIIVGTLIGGLLLWILLIIWLKKRKRSRGFKELEDGQVTFSPTEDIKVTPFMAHTPQRPNSLPNSIELNAKRRVVQEVIRSGSPATSIVDSGTYSHFYTLPLAGSQSQDPYSIATTSDPFKNPSILIKSPRGSVI